MKRLSIYFMCVVISCNLFAGNKDRAGEAGASELLINPWARGAGMANANASYVSGIEAMYLNVAGLASTKKTEIMFVHKQWLVGSEVNVNSFGLAQRIGETGVLGISVMSQNFGDIPITTTDLPEGGIGTFSPSYLNLGISYSKAFSDRIYGGVTAKVVNEAISNARAQAMCFDAGIRYVTGGELKKFKIGIALKNVGPPMKFTGDGLAYRVVDINTEIGATQEHRSAKFELPSQLSIAAAHDFYIGDAGMGANDSVYFQHKITAGANFVSNAFGKDQFNLGVEYSFKSLAAIRAGYSIEDGRTNENTRTSAYTGLSMGLSLMPSIGKNGTKFGIHYAYQMTERFAGTHSLGVEFKL